ncbi:hypothetical protein GSI_05740 [Ganoderma sinense ZZ0214-1]|uniref:Uncharacterized protein n=1 Tax=Ganoderma sinense ZZ0214-1 TaxID=1077348 RepID=A0A2G8SBA1_9APHY|nr:hypothetical protein GSI_05740 [Ganoderma sinense ZZ0214-1]
MKKWIGSFGTNHASATPAPVAVQQAPIISAADAKTFGLENIEPSSLGACPYPCEYWHESTSFQLEPVFSGTFPTSVS